MTEFVAERKSWAIAHGEEIHAIELEAGTHFATGQPNVEHFDSRDKWVSRLNQLGYDWSQNDSPEI